MLLSKLFTIPQAPNQGRLLELDALRGFAALTVVLYHYGTRYDHLYGHTSDLIVSVPLGNYGVHLFFVISGFVIYMTLERTKHGMDFVVSRFSRLFPAYWTALLITFTALVLFPLRGREVDLAQLFVNLSMLQSWLGVRHVDGVYWSLMVELSFYGLMMGLYLIRQLHRFELFAFIWLTSAIFLRVEDPYETVALFNFAKLALIPVFAHLFVAGVMFYKIRENKANWIQYAMLGYCLLCQYLMGSTVAFLIVLAIFATFMLLVFGLLSFIAQKPLIYLGTISYSLYLIHQNIGYMIMKWVYSLVDSTYLAILVALCCSLLIASVINFTIEKPSLGWIRALYRRTRIGQG